MVKRYLFFSLFLFSCIAALTCDARQGDHLTRLMKAKKAKKIDNKSGFHVQAVELAEALIPQEGSKAIDKIQRLPGQLSNVNFTQYGGYVTIDEQAGRALYYYFAEVDGADPSSKPLVLWLNGGPGCSSLGIGAFTELGPFRVHSGGKTLYENRFAWNKVANVLFLESPAGIKNFNPCSGIYVHTYLNLPEVQEALHAVTRLESWTPCSQVTDWNDSPWSVLDLFSEFFAQGIRVWVYSGDTDGIVPVTST
ncbi:hypothetical protein AAC387_Pa11g0509 [Persea americana]